MPDEPEPEADDRNGYEIRKPSRWRWLKRLVLSVSISLLIYFAWQLGNREWTKRQGERELATARAEAEHGDPNWTWEPLTAARPMPPAGKNGAELIPRIKKLMHPDWGKWQTQEEWKPRLDVQPNVWYSADILREIRRELTDSADALALARTLKDRPFGHREIVLKPNVLDTLLEDTQNTRHVSDLLRWDVVIAIEDGDTRRAPETILASLNASRSIGDEPFLISQMIRMAIRTVAVRSAERLVAQAPDSPALAELQAALAADAEEPLLLHGVRGDRAVFDRLFENLHNGIATPGRTIDSGFNDAEGRFAWWHYRVNLLTDRAFALSWMTQCVEYARLPIHEQPAAYATILAPPKDPKRMLSSLLLPAVEKVAEAHWRSTAEARCAVVGIACERFRQQHKRWPDSLAELVPAFIPAVPLDPFNGQPLRFAKLPEGVVVYSVGKDLRGDAGTLDPLPAHTTPVARFRLWNPEHRRQPAPPDTPPMEQDP